MGLCSILCVYSFPSVFPSDFSSINIVFFYSHEFMNMTNVRLNQSVFAMKWLLFIFNSSSQTLRSKTSSPKHHTPNHINSPLSTKSLISVHLTSHPFFTFSVPKVSVVTLPGYPGTHLSPFLPPFSVSLCSSVCAFPSTTQQHLKTPDWSKSQKQGC